MGNSRLKLLAANVCVLVVAGVLAAPALALSPSVETLPASAVGENDATLNAKINPNGLETQYFFEYGPTTSYGSKTAETSAGSGSTLIEKSQKITGLTKKTTYHYRIVAKNSSGTSQGSDLTFTTAAPPEAGTGNPKTESSGEGATFIALIAPNGQTTTYQFEYGTASGAYSTTVPIPAENLGITSGFKIVEYKVTGLTPGTKYFYRVTASNAGGKVNGNEVSFYSSKIPLVKDLSASEITATAAKLNGTVVPNTLATKYYFEYGPTTSYGSKEPVSPAEISGEVASSPVSVPISKLSVGTTYHYRLVAENSAGTTYSSDQQFTTLAAGTLWIVEGEQVKVGTKLKLVSADFTMGGGAGNCNGTEIEGEVTENPGAVQSLTTSKVQNNTGTGRCYWSFGNTLKLSVPTVQFEYRTANSGEGVAIFNQVVMSGTVYNGEIKVAECEFAVSMRGEFETEKALLVPLAGTWEVKKGGVFCYPAGWASGTFGFTTTSGKFVEVRP